MILDSLGQLTYMSFWTVDELGHGRIHIIYRSNDNRGMILKVASRTSQSVYMYISSSVYRFYRHLIAVPVYLQAYSLHDREVGYCQGSGFIVGLLLMIMPEEEAFSVLIQVWVYFSVMI